MSKPEAGQWKAEYERLAEAVRFAIDYAGGRESEWGERAEECFRILETAVSRKPAQPQRAEDPEEWVEITDPEHVLRDCDQISDYGTQWYPPSELTYAKGKALKDCGFKMARCRRKDLPKPKRTVTVLKWLCFAPSTGWWVVEQEKEPSSYNEVHRVGETTYEIQE